jgi:hypothetical protein
MEHVKTVKTEETGAAWRIIVVEGDPPRKTLVTDPARHSARTTAEDLTRIVHDARIIPRMEESNLKHNF